MSARSQFINALCASRFEDGAFGQSRARWVHAARCKLLALGGLGAVW